MKIAIIGNPNFKNERAIKDLLYKLKEKYNDLIIISTSGKYGVEKLAKKSALDLHIKYIEVPKLNEKWNAYCEGNGRKYYMYNKEYNSKFFYYQISDIIKNSNIIVFFNSSKINQIKEQYEKQLKNKKNKKLIIL